MERSEEIRKSYRKLGGFADLYDSTLTYTTLPGRLLNRMIWGFDKESTDLWIHQALAKIPEDFHGRLLEVPAGTGVLTMPLYASLPDAEIVCLDISETMMAHARERAKDLANVSFVQGDVGSLPFADENFDIVLSLNGFHAFPDKLRAYTEIYRVLKPGGIFCGCFYIAGEEKKTDRFVKKVFVPKGAFTPPFETRQSLTDRLNDLYEDVEVKAVRAEGIFSGRKKEKNHER